MKRQTFAMCLMNCGDVSSLFLLRSNEKEVAAASRFGSKPLSLRTILAGILYKCRMPMGHASRLLRFKKH